MGGAGGQQAPDDGAEHEGAGEPQRHDHRPDVREEREERRAPPERGHPLRREDERPDPHHPEQQAPETDSATGDQPTDRHGQGQRDEDEQGCREHGVRARLRFQPQAAEPRGAEGVAEQAQALGPHPDAEVQGCHRHDGERHRHLRVAERPGDAGGARGGEQGAREQQAGLPAQAQQVTGDDGEEATVRAQPQPPPAVHRGGGLETGGSQVTREHRAAEPRGADALGAQGGQPEAAQRGRRAERPRARTRVSASVVGTGSAPDSPAPTWPASHAPATTTPSAGPASERDDEGRRARSCPTPTGHPRAPRRRPVAPATSRVAETSHHSRRVVARSRGPATTWSTHGSGGTTGPRRRPSPWTSAVSATASSDGHHRRAGTEQPVVQPPGVARDEQGARHGEAVR